MNRSNAIMNNDNPNSNPSNPNSSPNNYINSRDHDLDPNRFVMLKKYESGLTEIAADNLTLKECGDIERFPVCPQEDDKGVFRYVQTIRRNQT